MSRRSGIELAKRRLSTSDERLLSCSIGNSAGSGCDLPKGDNEPRIELDFTREADYRRRSQIRHYFLVPMYLHYLLRTNLPVLHDYRLYLTLIPKCCRPPGRAISVPKDTSTDSSPSSNGFDDDAVRPYPLLNIPCSIKLYRTLNMSLVEN